LSLGFLYQKGLGLPSDIHKASFWLLLASGVDELGVGYQMQLEGYLRENKRKLGAAEMSAIYDKVAAWKTKHGYQ